MKKHFHIYLAGPDVFRPEEKIKELAGYLKSVCRSAGHRGHFPLDNDLQPDKGNYRSNDFSLKIFRANISMIDRCDVVLANLENFRGPNVDDGTAFEIGYAFALKKIVYGYSPTSHSGYKQVYENFAARLQKDHRTAMEADFPQVEDFEGNTANLMITGAIRDSGGKIFHSAEECLEDLVLRHSGG